MPLRFQAEPVGKRISDFSERRSAYEVMYTATPILKQFLNTNNLNFLGGKT
jgi:hypothetical protein